MFSHLFGDYGIALSLRVGRRETMLNAGIALCFAMFYFFLVTFLPEALRDFSHLRPALWSWRSKCALRVRRELGC